MLVLRRKVGQQIIIAGNIRITVFALQGQQVKIGIEAPADVPIVRAELASQSEQQVLPLLSVTHQG